MGEANYKNLDQTSMIASLAIQILSIRVPAYFIPDALVATAGMDETEAISLPIEVWQKSVAEYFLVAGMNIRERKYHPITIEELKKSPYNLIRTENVYTKESCSNTPDQTDWIIDQAIELGVSKLFFYARPYHIVRAYLTLLKSWIKSRGNLIIMIPVPLAIPPNAIVPAVVAPARSLIPGEIEKILSYQEKGDVATIEELEKYLDVIAPIIYPNF